MNKSDKIFEEYLFLDLEELFVKHGYSVSEKGYIFYKGNCRVYFSVHAYSGGIGVQPWLKYYDEELIKTLKELIPDLVMSANVTANPYTLSKYFNVPLSHSEHINFEESYLSYPMFYKSSSNYYLNKSGSRIYFAHQEYLLDRIYKPFFNKFETTRSTLSFYSDIFEHNRNTIGERRGNVLQIQVGTVLSFIYLCNYIGETGSLYQSELEFLLDYYKGKDYVLGHIQKIIDHFK